ncbi:MAG TPA: aminoglycoside phosphotransferase family protein [Burkholderiales bacterium]|nr:aminoglycoside phosphotransferase family protein [Burkholderiales bacterium]
MSASLPEPVLRLLRSAGLVSANEIPPFAPLTGGVSSEIWRVGNVCVKRALPRLRVAQVWEAPIERNRYERLWLEAAGAAAPGAAPRVLAFDDEAGLFAMEYVPFPVWKEQLRQGEAVPEFAAEVGARLAAIHKATAGRPDIAERFATDAIFHAIRLEPYLLFAGTRHPELRRQLEFLVNRTAQSKLCLVHGDVSPKNILVDPRGPVFLDAECAWYGDPAFDLAFCLNHLLLKCLWVPPARAAFLECFDALARSYLQAVTFPNVEQRAASLLPALLLARVDGKSPVEYLGKPGQEHVRCLARELLPAAANLKQIREAWQRSST